MGGAGADGARGGAAGGLSQPEERFSSAQQRHSHRDHNSGASRKARKGRTLVGEPGSTLP